MQAQGEFLPEWPLTPATPCYKTSAFQVHRPGRGGEPLEEKYEDHTFNMRNFCGLFYVVYVFYVPELYEKSCRWRVIECICFRCFVLVLDFPDFIDTVIDNMREEQSYLAV